MDGTREAIGAHRNDANGKSNAGHVRVYEYSASGWGQLGADIEGMDHDRMEREEKARLEAALTLANERRENEKVFKDMRITVVTTFHQPGLEQYGQRFIDSFSKIYAK